MNPCVFRRCCRNDAGKGIAATFRVEELPDTSKAATLKHPRVKERTSMLAEHPSSGAGSVKWQCYETALRVGVVIDIDVVLVDVEQRTAFCSDGVTRTFFQMYDAEAQPTDDPDEAIAAVVKVGDNQYIVVRLTDEQSDVTH
jgi:hypothetical protein